MNILRPIRFVGYLEEGGSTKPWVVLLSGADENPEPYVVKLFTPKHIEQQHAVAKEIYGNILAREFSLPTPDYVLVDFDSAFINSILEEEQRKILRKKDHGLKYASRLAESMSIVSPILYKKYLKEYEIANIFAFDCLIYNLDRGGMRDKPNLLVDDENFLLIDHEQVFPFADNTSQFYEQIVQRFENGELMYPYSRHLFYQMLRDLRSKDKVHLFNEFEEYLKKLKLGTLLLTINDLKKHDVSLGHYQRIIDYLRIFSQNAHKFCNILLSYIDK